jgi:hypothetical protein
VIVHEPRLPGFGYHTGFMCCEIFAGVYPRPRIRSSAAAAVWILLATLIASGASADAIVLAVEGTRAWERGQLVTEGTVIHLPAGATLKLILENDDVVLLPGPFDGRVHSANEDGFLYSLVKRFLNAVKLAVRAEREPRAGDPDVIDLSTSGAKCVSRTVPPVLWKPKYAEAERAIITTSGESEDARWNANEMMARWPRNLPQTARREYVVNFVRTGEARTFTLHFKPARIVAPKAVAAWMLSEGCFDQAAAALGRLTADRTSTAASAH